MKLFNWLFNKTFIRIFFAFCIIASTSGCSNRLKERLGFIEHGPDEFTIIAYPELVVPDTFELPTPHPIMHKPKHMHRYSDTSMQNSEMIDLDEEKMNLDESDQIFLQQFN